MFKALIKQCCPINQHQQRAELDGKSGPLLLVVTGPSGGNMVEILKIMKASWGEGRQKIKKRLENIRTKVLLVVIQSEMFTYKL